MSSLHIIPQVLLFNIKFMASLAIRNVSRICLPFTKAFWDLKVTFPNTFFILFAKTIARISYQSPTKLIDLKFFKSFGPPFFGVNTKSIELRLFSNLPPSWNLLKNPIISSFTKSKLNCQKAMINHPALEPYPCSIPTMH